MFDDPLTFPMGSAIASDAMAPLIIRTRPASVASMHAQSAGHYKSEFLINPDYGHHSADLPPALRVSFGLEGTQSTTRGVNVSFNMHELRIMTGYRYDIPRRPVTLPRFESHRSIPSIA